MAEYNVRYRIGVDTGDSPEKLSKVAKGAQDVDQKMAKVAATTGQGSGSATYALTNFNRVVQDAPYGLMGVANNIDPMMTSFQKLKAETGSTSAAFKAMAGTLSGPMGVLFGINAVVFAAQVLPGLLAKISKSSLDVSKDFRKMRDAVVEKTFATNEDIKKLVVQQLQIESVTSAMKKNSLSTQDKKYWIAELNKEYKPYLEQLEGHKVSEKNLAIALNSVNQQLSAKIDNMINEKIVEKMAEEIATKKMGILKIRTDNQNVISDIVKLKQKHKITDEDIRNWTAREMSSNAPAVMGGPRVRETGPVWLPEAKELLRKLRDNLSTMDKSGLQFVTAMKELEALTADTNYKFGVTPPVVTPPGAKDPATTLSTKTTTEDRLDPLEKLIELELNNHIERLDKIYLDKYQKALLRDKSKDPLSRPSGKKKDNSLDNYDPTNDPYSSLMPNVRSIEQNGIIQYMQKLLKQMTQAVDLSGSLKKGFNEAGSSLASTISNGIVLFREQNSLLEMFITNLVRATTQAIILAGVNSLFGWLGGAIPFLSFLSPVGAASGGGNSPLFRNTAELLKAANSAQRQTMNVGGTVSFKASGRDLKATITAEELFRATQR